MTTAPRAAEVTCDASATSGALVIQYMFLGKIGSVYLYLFPQLSAKEIKYSGELCS